LTTITIGKVRDLPLTVRLQPKSSRNEILGVQDNQLKVQLTAPPIDGKATYLAVQIHHQKLCCREQPG